MNESASTPVLRIRDLNVTIGVRSVVKNLCLDLAAGEILGLVGASGCGKSMTARAIMQLLPPGAVMTGSVESRGERWSGTRGRHMQRVRGRDVGMIFQDPASSLNPLMRIGDQVAETIRLHRAVSRAQARIAARAALDQVGLPGEAGGLDRLPYELSGGQRQRVAIAMAIVMAPRLLIADEPTTALDVITQAQVLALLQELAKSRGMGLLLITHDLAVVARLADRVAVMRHGTLIEQGSTREILHQSREPYTQSLLAAARLQRKRAPSPPLGAVVLEVEGVVQEYPRKRRSLFKAAMPLRAVDGASLSIRAGETVGLVGESGSGKSSLLQVILALKPPRQGRVTLMGKAFSAAGGTAAGGTAVRRLRRDMQAVFQDPVGSFDPRWSVERLVAEPFFLLKTPPDTAQRSRKVAEVLEQVGLNAGDAHRHPHEFSGGQRQRIAIARALITEPAVIVLDEAVSALDVLVREQILELLAQLAQRSSLAYLFVTHDLHVIRAIADRVYVMQSGRIVEEGATESLFRSPRHPYTRALLAATPQLPA
jgi:peptide/nickel transport system ATP-binding protein